MGFVHVRKRLVRDNGFFSFLLSFSQLSEYTRLFIFVAKPIRPPDTQQPSPWPWTLDAAVNAVITTVVAALRFPFSFTPYSQVPSNVLTQLLRTYLPVAVSVLSKTNRNFVRRRETTWTSENVAQKQYFGNVYDAVCVRCTVI